MIGTIALLLGFQLTGEAAVRLLDLPVPGPVVGMVMLFAALAIRGAVPDEVSTVANGLLAHLALLFVPAGVGIIAHTDRLEGIWPILLVVLIASTLMAVAVTAVTLSAMRRLQQGRGGK
jgi:putative effector of murein hydrolase LrgA (UPF0299 family)